MTRFAPIPDPCGSLDPPRRYPPTALGTATPEPEPRPDPVNEAAYRAALEYCSSLLRRVNEFQPNPFANLLTRVMHPHWL